MITRSFCLVAVCLTVVSVLRIAADEPPRLKPVSAFEPIADERARSAALF